MADQYCTIQNPRVAEVYAAYPAAERAGLMDLRRLIFETAAATKGVGSLEETLKWGQPAYLTSRTKSGTTIRLGLPKTGGFAIYMHCQTSVIADFQTLFSTGFTFDGNRAVLFAAGQELPKDPLRLLIRNALTYHLS